MVTCDMGGGVGGSSYSACRGDKGRMPNLDAPVFKGTPALTKHGSQKRAKDTGELTKMVNTNAP